MKETPLVRKSLHKPYWYDKTSYVHSRNFGILIYFLIIYLILSVVLGFLYSLNTTIISLVVLLGVILAFKLYNSYHYRYYRLIKRTIQKSHLKEKRYIIQTCISGKKIEEIGEEKNRRWLDFYIADNRGFDYIKNAEYRFNEATTNRKVTDEIL